MTHKVVISGQASRQLDQIYDYIATRTSTSTAERFVDSILDYCQDFDIFPERGMRRDDLAPGLRVIGFRRTAAITFVVEADEVIISGIFYGGQNYDETLPIGEA